METNVNMTVAIVLPSSDARYNRIAEIYALVLGVF